MDFTDKEFEILLCEFCKQDLPLNFKVEHNIKDFGEESENKRQIDTKITGKLGISDILICGEAKYWNKPVGNEEMDAIIGKYFSNEIRANKVIIFSNKGFAKPAIKRAKKHGIELLEPKEKGIPIQVIPHIVGVGYIKQMITKIVGGGPQYIEMAINQDEYVILKGTENISFQQNIFRLIVSRLRGILNKNIHSDLSQIKVEDKNVLYELKSKPGYRYSADFEVTVTIFWDYFIENLKSGILHHLNSGEVRFVVLQGNPFEVLNKILLSSTKLNFESREKCIKAVVEKSKSYTLHLCMADPDKNKSDPNTLHVVPV